MSDRDQTEQYQHNKHAAEDARSTMHGTESREKQQDDPNRTQEKAASAPWTGSPFALMRRFSEEMDNLFEDLSNRDWTRLPWGGRNRESGQAAWFPQIEIFEKNNQLEISADLPGLKKDDIKVEFKGDKLIIQGQRRREYEETKEGLHRNERSYGSFHRSIPLPEGVQPETATASFENGVLKIVMSIQQHEKQRGRRIDIN